MNTPANGATDGFDCDDNNDDETVSRATALLDSCTIGSLWGLFTMAVCCCVFMQGRDG